MKSKTKTLAFAVMLFTSLVPSANADIQYFEAIWSGVPHGNSATAIALVGIDTALIPNPDDYFEFSALPAWFDSITLTVSGATSGNGTFTISDFGGVAWGTNGGTLDFGSELVGQSTNGDPWGTIESFEAGDFNLFAAAESPSAPSGTSYFQLSTAESSEAMSLTSFSPVAIPELATSTLLILCAAAMLIFFRKKKQ
ncbi:MAG: hypothetical protein JJU29_22820 [Verrucomicrobia bacterium]|nr:hypothetical protein [Verrucomicrobiota bacterium]MCH8510831.1 hypothetical protein [Kiritimatiellia bacterium]